MLFVELTEPLHVRVKWCGRRQTLKWTECYGKAYLVDQQSANHSSILNGLFLIILVGCQGDNDVLQGVGDFDDACRSDLVPLDSGKEEEGLLDAWCVTR